MTLMYKKPFLRFSAATCKDFESSELRDYAEKLIQEAAQSESEAGTTDKEMAVRRERGSEKTLMAKEPCLRPAICKYIESSALEDYAEKLIEEAAQSELESDSIGKEMPVRWGSGSHVYWMSPFSGRAFAHKVECLRHSAAILKDYAGKSIEKAAEPALKIPLTLSDKHQTPEDFVV